jgi:hypothetical protein
MTAPRLRYAAPALHPSLAHVPTPAHLAPTIPRARRGHGSVRIDPGYTPWLVEDRPTRAGSGLDLSDGETPRERAQRERRERDLADPEIMAKRADQARRAWATRRARRGTS